MAIGVTDVLYLQHHKFKLEDLNFIIDLGVQEVTCPLGHEVLHDFISRTNPQAGTTLDWVKEKLTAGWAKDFWTACRKEYLALDVAGEGQYMFFDLNHDSVPQDLLGRGDLVCNAGTTEHLLNQYNAFKVMHDLTRVGGYMYHALPMAGFHDHGLFNYNIKFFQQLACHNKYTLVDAFVSLGYPFKGLDKDSRNSLNQNKIFLEPGLRGVDSLQEQFHGVTAGLRVVLRKVKDTEFRASSDLLGADARHIKVGEAGHLTKK